MGDAAPRPKLLTWRLPVLVAVTGMVFYVLWTRVADSDALWATMRAVDPAALALGAGLMGVSVTFGAFRLQFVLSAIGYRVPLGMVFRAILSTWPLALVAPSRLNELLRAVVLRDEVPMAEGAGAVLAERVVDVAMLCMLAAVGGALTGQWVSAAVAGAGFLGVVGVALGLARWPDAMGGLPLLRRKPEKVRALVGGFRAFGERPAALLGTVACSLGVWLVAVSIISVLLGAFGGSVTFFTALALWPLAVFAGLLPVTLSGMGTRDIAFLTLLTVSGYSGAEEPVLSASIAYAVVTTLLPAVLGLPWMIGQLDRFQREWT